MDVDKMALDCAMKEFEGYCVFNAYVVINEKRKLIDFWQKIVDMKQEEHRERLINLYGKSEEESGVDTGEHSREGE